MKEYHGQLKEQNLSTKVAIIGIGAYIMYRAFYTNIFFAPLGLALIIAAFFKKEQIISDKGVELKYFICGFPFNNTWQWDEVTSIHLDYKLYEANRSPYVQVHIGRDIVTRTYNMTREDAVGATELAKEKNPAIIVADVD